LFLFFLVEAHVVFFQPLLTHVGCLAVVVLRGGGYGRNVDLYIVGYPAAPEDSVELDHLLSKEQLGAVRGVQVPQLGRTSRGGCSWVEHRPVARRPDVSVPPSGEEPDGLGGAPARCWVLRERALPDLRRPVTARR